MIITVFCDFLRESCTTLLFRRSLPRGNYDDGDLGGGGEKAEEAASGGGGVLRPALNGNGHHAQPKQVRTVVIDDNHIDTRSISEEDSEAAQARLEAEILEATTQELMMQVSARKRILIALVF